MTEQVTLPKTAFSRVGRLVGSRGGAELVGNAAFVGSVLLAESLIPHQLSNVKAFVAEHIVRPHLAMFDSMADALPALEGEQNADQRHMMDEDEKSDLIASALVDYTIKFSAGIAAKTLSLKLFDRAVGMPALARQTWYKDPHFISTMVADHGAQIGAFLFLNTAGKGMNSDMQHTFASFLEKRFNVTPEHAQAVARDAVNFQLINALGFAAGTTYLDKHYRDLFKQLQEQGVAK